MRGKDLINKHKKVPLKRKGLKEVKTPGTRNSLKAGTRAVIGQSQHSSQLDH
jgi:hypothetical protein